MLEIGEKVVYQHRVCTVTGIREAYIDGRDYYELEALYERALKLFIFGLAPNRDVQFISRHNSACP